MLAQAFADNDEDAKKFIQKQFAKTINNALKGINEDNTYKMLDEKDKTSHADTREDPSLDDMRKIREEQAKNKKLPKDRKITSK
jgi:hypothetical protein